MLTKLTGEYMQISLSDFVKTRTQTDVSKALNVEQSYISQTLKAGKNVFVICNDDGSVERAIEIKPFPSKRYKNKQK